MFLGLHFLHFLHEFTLRTDSVHGKKSVKSEGPNKSFFSAMTANHTQYRYHLPLKAIKSDCPDCAPKYRKTLSRYVDFQTGEPLPEPFGRCDRESNCTYHLSPYHKGLSGASYADEVSQTRNVPKEWFRLAAKWKRNGTTHAGVIQTLQTQVSATAEQAERVADYLFQERAAKISPSTAVVYCIPDEVFQRSLVRYNDNQFARLLDAQFGASVAAELLQQFRVGTSKRWPGACVFWYIDERGRKRGGQIKLFGDDWHTAKYVDREGKTRSCTSWVHSALLRRCQQEKTPVPNWLGEYDQRAERSPCLFGLPQLLTAPADKPVAIVEAPKTAVVCSHYLPGFTWLAVGGKSYLNAERLAPVKHRNVTLYPDLNAYHDFVNEKEQVTKGWSTRAKELRQQGFRIVVSDYLEQRATDEQRKQGLDLADFLLNLPPTVSTIGEWSARPGSILRPNESKIERLEVEVCDTYPPEWDALSSHPS